MHISSYNKRLPSKSFMSFLYSDPSLKEILDNDETEREIRIGNPWLLERIEDSDLSYLISLITKEPELDSSDNRAFRYPFLAHLFFLPNSQVILEKVLSSKDHLLELMSFLGSPDCRNDTLSGYFSTVFMSLYNQHPATMLAVVYENGFHAKLVEILESSHNSHLADVLYQVLSAPDSPQGFIGYRLDLLSVLLSIIQSRNVKDIILRLVDDSITTSSYDTLMEFLVFEVNLHQIVKRLEEREVVPHVCEVLEALLNTVGGHEGLINALADHMEVFASILSQHQNRLGPHRLAVLKLLRTGIEHADDYLAEAICDSKVLAITTSLFEQFPWNSFLHVVYYDIVEASLKNPMLKTHIFEGCGLISMLKRNRPSTSLKSRNFRKGSMGCVFKIARYLLLFSQVDSYISRQLRSEDWISFRYTLDLQTRLESNILGKGRCYTSKYVDNIYWKVPTTSDELEDLD